jgi:hypothetical protein
VSPWLLGALVLIDGTLCGFRAAAGRNPRLFLRDYYAASLRRGALLSVLVVGAFLGVAMLVKATSPVDWSALLLAADAMVFVYGLYAMAVLGALGLYVVGHFDLGVLATVLVLGPFTLVRPLVIVGGAVWACVVAPEPLSIAFCLCAAIVMIGFERLLAFGSPPWRGMLPPRN